MKMWLCLALFAMGCNNSRTGGGGDGGGGGTTDLAGHVGDTDGGQAGCGGAPGCYTVYAHADHVLYRIDLQDKLLVEVGPFKAPQVMNKEDVINDLAVSPADEIFGISATNLYRVSAVDGHVTLVGPVTACGTFAVALTFAADGKLYAADFGGAFCRIDPSSFPPTVTPVGTIGSGLAVSGDLVAVADGTMYATAYRLADAQNMGTNLDNLLIKIDPATGHSTQVIGPTGFPKLFGVAYDNGVVFGFTHDGTGHVITINPTTGAGTLYNTFTDTSTGMGIAFAGAAVNAMVPPGIM